MTGRALGQVTIRRVQSGDLARVVEIYNAGIAERVATFETEPHTAEDISSWLEDGQSFIVAVDHDEVIGWVARARTPTAACTRAWASTPCTFTPTHADAGSDGWC
jgi:hypothetical protein